MTREEEIISNQSDSILALSAEIEKLHKEIDDFESRTCESCRYLNEYGRCLGGVIPTSEVVNGVDVSISDTFNCNKWENR